MRAVRSGRHVEECSMGEIGENYAVGSDRFKGRNDWHELRIWWQENKKARMAKSQVLVAGE